jgi:hypothetical protein
MADTRNLDGRALQRILSTPHLAQAVPRLPPDLLHRVIQHHGLEDSGELVALATPEQLNRVLDLDLWRSTHPGLDEQFDARRFGTWLQVLLDGRGAAGAARSIAELPIEGTVVALSQHVRVFDVASLTYERLDGTQVNLRADGEAVACEVGGYRLEARRDDAWGAIVEVLLALDENHRDRFEQIVRGCRTLSNSRPEESGMHDLLDDPEQVMFDLAAVRERRREQAGYATPAQARAFLEAARRLRVDTGVVPPAHPAAQAYFRALADTPDGAPDSVDEAGKAVAHPPQDARAADEGVAAVIEVLRESGVLDSSRDQTRALPAGEPDQPLRLSRIRAALQSVSDREALAIARQGELGYLANVMMAGCSIQDRPFETPEASDAVLAVCNLGLEHWPGAAHDDVLVAHDLVQLFQVGWAALHQRVALRAARRLIDALITVRSRDRDVQIGVARLRADLERSMELGTPWRARSSLEVLASLDLPAWAALRGLLDECPVMTSALAGSRDAHRINPAAFAFISEKEQIARVEQFLETLPQLLSPA